MNPPEDFIIFRASKKEGGLKDPKDNPKDI